MNKCNVLHDDKPTDTPRECNSQPPASHFKYVTSLPKTVLVVSAITGRLNHRAIDNGDVEVHPSEFTFESNYEYVPDTDTTLIKSIDNDKIDHLLELFHSEYDDNILDVDLPMV